MNKVVLFILVVAGTCGAQQVLPAIGSVQSAPAALAQCGYPTVGVNTDNSPANYNSAFTTCIPSASGTLKYCDIYTGSTANGTVICALYDSDGPSGKPGTLLSQNIVGVLAAPNTFNRMTMPAYSMVSGHTYYVARNHNAIVGGQYFMYDSTGNTLYYYPLTYGPFDNPFSTTPSSASNYQGTGYVEIQ